MFERVLQFQARQNPDGVAIWSDGAEITFGRLERDVARVTTAFALEDLPLRSIVVLYIPNLPLLWLVALALERLGHATVCIISDLEAQIGLIRPDVVVTTASRLSGAAAPRVIVITDDWRKRALSQVPSKSRSPAEPDDLVRIVMSSGTTGLKKQIPLTRRVVDERSRGASYVTAPTTLRYLATMGADTISGFSRPLSTWTAGGTIVFASNIDEDALRRSRPNVASMSPIQLRALLEPLSKVFTADHRIRIVVSGSAMPPALIRDAVACPGLELLILYGSTEAGTVVYGPARLGLERSGAVGYVAPWAEIEIVDEDGQAVAGGTAGTVRIRSTRAADGYRSSETADRQFRDGWFYPNDMGRIDSDGVLIIEGRSDDVINIGGIKHSSTRIEEVILDCEGVADAAVVAFPMTSGQWRVFAAIVSTSTYSEPDIQSKVQKSFGFGVKVTQLARIERNGMGKIVRASVREALLAHERGEATTGTLSP